MDTRRRKLVGGAAAGVVTFGWWEPVAAQGVLATPSQTAGPFYPIKPPAEADSDLTRVAGAPSTALGEIVFLSGLVFDAAGKPIRGARVEIWQCNAHGRYHHPRDQSSAPLDPGFQGFGADNTDETGGYRFKTIHPVPYPGRTPHIHFRIAAPGRRAFVTQMYVAGHAGNARDDLLLSIADPRRRDSLLAPFHRLSSGASPEWTAKFDLVLPV